MFRRNIQKSVLVAMTVVALGLGAGNAQAAESIIKDTSAHTRPHMLSVFVNVPWWYGFGVGGGARYGFSVVPDGFIPAINDSFDLEFGADYVFRRFLTVNYHSIIIPAEARWSFYLLENLSVYGKVGLGLEIGFGGVPLFGVFGGVGNGVAFYHQLFSAGVVFKLTDSMALRGELGYWGAKAGLGFVF